MTDKPTYKELKQRIRELEREANKSKQMELALIESLEEVSAIYDTASLIMFLVDQDRRVRKIGKAGKIFAWRSGEEVLGHRVGEVLRCIHHLDDIKGCGFGPACGTCVVQRLIIDTLETGKRHRNIETTHSFLDDEVNERTLLISTDLLDLPDKKVLVCIEDISKSKQAEVVIENFFDLPMNLHIIAGFDGAIKRVNKGWETLLGHSKVELESTPFYELVHPDDLVSTKKEMRKLEQGETTFYFENRYRCKDGTYRWLAWSAISSLKDQLFYAVAIDITERKEAEDSLERSGKRYRRLVEGSPDLIYSYSTTKGGIFYSQNIQSVLGYPVSYFLKNPYLWHDSVHQDDVNRVDTAIKEFQDGEMFNVEYRIKDSNGDWHWFLDRSIGRMVVNDEIIIEGVATDITDRKQAEVALQKSEEKYRIVTENSQTGIYIHQDEKIIYVNNKFAELHGYTVQELLNTNYFELFHPDDKELVMRLKSKRLRGEYAPQYYESRKVKKDGGILWCQTNSVLIDYLGKPAIMGNLVDVTECKLAVEALRESEEKYRTVLEGIPDPVIAYDTEGKVLYLNPAFTRVFGWSSQERFGEKMDIFVPGESQHVTKMMIDKIKAGEEFSGLESKRFTKDGSIIDVSISASVYRDAAGNPIGTIVNLRDITEHKRLAELIIAKEHAETASLAKSEFLGNISHELRSPLNIINGMIYLCLQTELTEQQKGYLQKLEKAGCSLLMLINDLLDFSMIEEGDLKIEPTPFYLESFLGELKGRYSPIARKKNIDLDISISSEVPVTVFGDARRLRQILSNLLDNAIKFTKKGRVAMRIDRESSDEHLTLCFAIEDTGIGIMQDQVGQLFKPFTQIDGSTTRKYGGTGLGLSLTKRLVEMMGGTISVESEKGKGSTFSFTAVFEVVSKDLTTDLEGVAEIETTDTSKTAEMGADAIEPLDMANITQKIAELSVLIGDSDTRAVKKIMEIKNELKIPGIREEVAMLENALAEYDFEEAMAALNLIMGQIEMQSK